MGRRGVEHEVLGAGGGDDTWRQQDVDDRLQQQENLGLLQVGAVCRGQRCTTQCFHDSKIKAILLKFGQIVFQIYTV